MDLEELAQRAYNYDPQSLESLTRAARRLRDDYRHDSHPYRGGSMSQGAAEHGARISREYGLKALDMVCDLPDALAQVTPGGLPTAEAAAGYLSGGSHSVLMTRAQVVQRLYDSPYRMQQHAAEILVDWLTLGGYLLEIRVAVDTGQVNGIRRTGKVTRYEMALIDAPRWVGVHLGVYDSAPHAPLIGQPTLYAHDQAAWELFA
ncbi:hypothetical protein [Streptomyces albogriseolus]|uniref:hypothetical protein n=1 Tax=Streptomyces albogriseolus TaxID=1887 RepID=UPI00345F9388